MATPTDKPRVERAVPYVRNNFFAGETFVDLADVPGTGRGVVHRDGGHARARHHPVPAGRGVPRRGTGAAVVVCRAARSMCREWSEPKVHRDFHVEVDKAIYSAPAPPDRPATSRPDADSTTVKLYFRGELVKVHPRKAPGQRTPTRPTCPTGKEIYATRDIDRLRRMAADHGDAIGIYAQRVAGHPVAVDQDAPGLPAARTRQEVGAEPGRAGLPRALDAEAIDVNLMSAACSNAAAKAPSPTPALNRVVVQGRFARDPSEFATTKEAGR